MVQPPPATSSGGAPSPGEGEAQKAEDGHGEPGPKRARFEQPAGAKGQELPKRAVARQRPADDQLDPSVAHDDDEDVVMEVVRETRANALAQMIQELDDAGRKKEPVCEEPYGLDEPEYYDAFFDDVSGRELEPKLVREARQAKLETITPRANLEPGTIAVMGRWIDICKGDGQNVNYRSRHVAKEFKRGPQSTLAAEFFAAHWPHLARRSSY